jgi:SMC interacting uncharacterized protein involved in chromosome segregation
VSSEASPPREKDERERSRLERIVPELVKKLVDAGVERIADGPDSLKQILAELKLPKDALSVLTSQLDEARRDVSQVISREIREFLERSSLSEELLKLLSGLTLEIKTQIRFVPNKDGQLRPKTEVQTKLGTPVDCSEETHVNLTSRATVPPPSNQVSSTEHKPTISGKTRAE